MKKILTVIIGALLGFLYYKYYGCAQGCVIANTPLNSSIYGAAFGFVFSLEDKKR
tara:strand:+ start:628 stop:792 length:165 start_codon:yes stop_codon:yes gene_type:complete